MFVTVLTCNNDQALILKRQKEKGKAKASICRRVDADIKLLFCRKRERS